MSPRSLLISALSMLGLLVALPTMAATLASGSLIKGPGDAVYYYAANGKRLVFVNEKTFKTWYADFSTVKTITADELAAISLGGNVTYRPGVKMVKIMTDAKAYAVSAHGVLRWVSTEAIATQLYGADWNTKIDDVSDAYFVNYTVGSPIQNASDYLPSAQTAAATDIDADKQISGAPAPAPSPTPTSTTPVLTFSVSKPTAQAGDIETLTASASTSTSVSKIELFFDGNLVKACTISVCTGETTIPISATKASYVAEARLTKLSNEVVSQTITVTIQSDGSSLVQLTIGQAMIRQNQQASAVASADVSIAVNRIDIFVDGVDVKGCLTSGRECRWTDYIQGAVSSTHPVYAVVTDTTGRTYTSKTQTITISTNDSPSVTVLPAKASIYAGETVDVTVSATDNDGIASIEVLKDGIVLKHCVGAQPCTVTTGPWSQTTTLTFTGRATDILGAVGIGDPQSVSVVSRPTSTY